MERCARSSMDRASDSGSECWGFESLRAYQKRSTCLAGASFLGSAACKAAPPFGDSNARGRQSRPCAILRRKTAPNLRRKGAAGLWPVTDPCWFAAIRTLYIGRSKERENTGLCFVFALFYPSQMRAGRAGKAQTFGEEKLTFLRKVDIIKKIFPKRVAVLEKAATFCM